MHVVQVGSGAQTTPRSRWALTDGVNHTNLTISAHSLPLRAPFGVDVDQSTAERPHQVLAVVKRRAPTTALELTSIERLTNASTHFGMALTTSGVVDGRCVRYEGGDADCHHPIVNDNACAQPESKPCVFQGDNVWNRCGKLLETVGACGSTAGTPGWPSCSAVLFSRLVQPS
jgi:hypothetical protein